MYLITFQQNHEIFPFITFSHTHALPITCIRYRSLPPSLAPLHTHAPSQNICTCTDVPTYHIPDNPSDELIFLYRLIEGKSMSSHGYHCAIKAGMPIDIVQRAQQVSYSQCVCVYTHTLAYTHTCVCVLHTCTCMCVSVCACF